MGLAGRREVREREARGRRRAAPTVDGDGGAVDAGDDRPVPGVTRPLGERPGPAAVAEQVHLRPARRVGRGGGDGLHGAARGHRDDHERARAPRRACGRLLRIGARQLLHRGRRDQHRRARRPRRGRWSPGGRRRRRAARGGRGPTAPTRRGSRCGSGCRPSPRRMYSAAPGARRAVASDSRSSSPVTGVIRWAPTPGCRRVGSLGEPVGMACLDETAHAGPPRHLRGAEDLVHAGDVGPQRRGRGVGVHEARARRRRARRGTRSTPRR